MAYVQFTDSNKTAIVSVFACPQDPDLYPNQGEVDETDARYLAFMNPVIPLTCTPYQFVAALTQQNLRTQVESLIANASTPQGIKDAYNRAQVFIETDPNIISMATQLGQTTEQIHALFELARTLNA